MAGYKEASVTISAARAAHADEGFLGERDLGQGYGGGVVVPWYQRQILTEEKRVVEEVHAVFVS